jgi:DNA modification methylase
MTEHIVRPCPRCGQPLKIKRNRETQEEFLGCSAAGGIAGGRGTMITTHHGDCVTLLPTLVPGSVQSVITSPPYWGLRSYLPDDHPDKAHEIGDEAIPDCLGWAQAAPPCGDCYVCSLRAVFALIWRVLRDDGTCWINLGDAYANDRKWGGTTGGKHAQGLHGTTGIGRNRHKTGLPSKSLIGLPWRVALALQADGWTLRAEIIWEKPTAMPESVDDRPTRSHEQIFLFSKAECYFYDAGAIREPHQDKNVVDGVYRRSGGVSRPDYEPDTQGFSGGGIVMKDRQYNPAGRNARTIWRIPSEKYDGAHYATFPRKLVERCVLASTAPRACEHCGAPWRRLVEREQRPRGDAFGKKEIGCEFDHGQGGRAYMETVSITTTGFAPSCRCADNLGMGRCVVLDPFAGTGTTAYVAEQHGRDSILIELNAEYIRLMERRTNGIQLVSTDLWT